MKTNELLTVENFAGSLPDGISTIIGAPGEGKTTIVTELAFLLRAKSTSIFIPVGTLQPEEADQLADALVHRMSKQSEAKLTPDRHDMTIVILDGANEAPAGKFDRIFLSIKQICQSDQWRHVRFILTCRSTDYPAWFSPFTQLFSVMPLEQQEIAWFLSKTLGLTRGEKVFRQMLLDKHSRILRLSSNPLLLGMLVRLYLRGQDYEPNMGEIRTETDIYSSFVRDLEYWDIEKRPRTDIEYAVDQSLPSILEFIGWKMQLNNFVSVDSSEAIRWLREFITSREGKELLPREVEAAALYKTVRSYSLVEEQRRAFGFVHPSFGEYFCARYLEHLHESSSKAGDAERAYFQEQFESFFDSRYVLDRQDTNPAGRNWEALRSLCGSNRDVEWVLSAIEARATRLEDLSLLALAALCAKEMRGVRRTNVEDLAIRILNGEKYWGNPAHYAAWHLLGDLIPKLGATFPRRLIHDMRMFSERFTDYRNPSFLYHWDYDSLISTVSSSDSSLSADAVFTLSHMDLDEEKRSRLVSELLNRWKLLTDSQGWESPLGDQILSSFKELRATSTFDACRCVVEGSSTNKRTLTYALHALGTIGDQRGLQVLTDYVRDRSHLCRSAAIWGLKNLALNLMDSSPHLVTVVSDIVTEIYHDSLSNRSNNPEEDAFLQGNGIYALSMLFQSSLKSHRDEAEHVRQNIIRILFGVTKASFSSDVTNVNPLRLKEFFDRSPPYVQEDAINAIEILASKNCLGSTSELCQVLEDFLLLKDPLLRTRSMEALATLGCKNCKGSVSTIEGDEREFPFVTEVARTTLVTLGEPRPQELNVKDHRPTDAVLEAITFLKSYIQPRLSDTERMLQHTNSTLMTLRRNVTVNPLRDDLEKLERGLRKLHDIERTADAGLADSNLLDCINQLVQLGDEQVRAEDVPRWTTLANRLKKLT